MPTSPGDRPPRPHPYLVAEGVTSGYGGAPVIRDVSLGVGAGEIVAVIGPNGAGKSTFLKALVGILRVTQGTVRLGEDDVTNLPPEELARRGVGYVPQVGDIFEPLTVAENLEMGGYLLRPSAIPERIAQVCAVFPALGAMLRRRAEKLSGGERKMLAIARVLMLDPRVLILDEPTANLSPQIADMLLRERVRGLAGLGKAVLLVEQRAKAAMQIAHWTMVMVSGTNRLDGRPDDLLGRSDFEALFLGARGTPPSESTPVR
jgi:branched-chain amino acid transport system ATP-binding protein